ncbi:ATP-binding protein [Actinomadura welshii]
MTMEPGSEASDGQAPKAPTNAVTDSMIHGNVIQARTISTVNIGAPVPQVTPRQLPQPPPRLVGRDTELNSIEAFSAPEVKEPDAPVPVIVVSGMAGVGKTALATYWAHRVKDRFPDGHLYIDLRGFDPVGTPLAPVDILADFIRSLGTPNYHVPEGLQARAAHYRSLLFRKRVLIVLDNARDSAQVRPFLPGNATTLVIVTSRNRMEGLVALNGAQRLDLRVLVPQDALALLHTVIRDGRAERNPQAVRRIAKSCAYLPLALNIAAARVAARPTTSLERLAAELDADGLHFLDAIDDDVGAVRTACSWSYRVLDASLARLFRLLSLAPGPDVSTAVAAILTGVSTAAADRSLERLAAACLVQEHETEEEDDPANGVSWRRWRMHDLLREYALERCLQEEPEEERAMALRRVLDWQLDRARQLDRLLWSPNLIEESAPSPELAPAFNDLHEALHWYDRERASLVSAVSAAADHGELEYAWKIPIALYGAFYRRHHLDDLVYTHLIAASAADECGRSHAKAKALYGLGDAYGGQGRYQEAIASHKAALALFREYGDRRAEARVLHGLAHIYFTIDKNDQALELFLQALQRFNDIGDGHGIGHTLNGIANALSGDGRSAEALDYYERARQCFRAYDDKHGEGHTLFKIGDCYFANGELMLAVACYKQALKRFNEDSDHAMQARALAGLGSALLGQGKRADALACYLQARIEYQIAGDLAGSEEMSARIVETESDQGTA